MKQNKTDTFLISNFKELSERDPYLVTDLEKTALESNCFPSKIDVKLGIYSIYTDNKPEDEEKPVKGILSLLISRSSEAKFSRDTI